MGRKGYTCEDIIMYCISILVTFVHCGPVCKVTCVHGACLYQTVLSVNTDDSYSNAMCFPCRPHGRRFLVEIVQAFPVPGNTVVKTYFKLLLFTEIALQMKSAVNVVAFFPTWVRGALKKGTFLVTEARLEHIPLQLQQKRVKVCGIGQSVLCIVIRDGIGLMDGVHRLMSSVGVIEIVYRIIAERISVRL